jgi:hypothetical protein
MVGRIAASALTAALAACLFAPAAAEASFHLLKVREVYPGSSNESYVVLQMYAAGETFLGGHSMTVYDASGKLVHGSSFSGGVANGQNQRTVLVGDSGVQTTFGVAPDLVDSELSISATGGAACWNAGGFPADCVAWGAFSGGAALETATGTSAGSPVSPLGVTSGKAIRRTIAPGCPTLLESGDDSNDSATDFAEVSPAPRNNASAILETACPNAPNTSIEQKPPSVTDAVSAKFTYKATDAEGFECKLDGAGFSECANTGVEYSSLSEGAHSFQVRGFNVSGPDPTPASYSWRVDTTPPTATIDQRPDDPSSGGSATFAFHSDETGSSFQCSLAKGAAPDSFSSCSSGKTYLDLEDGSYTFKVRAIDQAGNQQPTPTAFTWTVDNSLGDTTPPQTTIVSKPADPSTSSTVSFTYASNEPGSSFECSLDGSAFSSCPVSGITYANLADGLHSFQVRAVDAAANVDPSPAGYSFSVVAPLAPPPPPPLARVAPQTLLSAKPGAKTRDRTPTFRFRSDVAGARFQCALDRGRFKPCRSPFTTTPLSFGAHVFKVRAAAAGLTDPSPARFRFKVVRGK